MLNTNIIYQAFCSLPTLFKQNKIFAMHCSSIDSLLQALNLPMIIDNLKLRYGVVRLRPGFMDHKRQKTLIITCVQSLSRQIEIAM